MKNISKCLTMLTAISLLLGFPLEAMGRGGGRGGGPQFSSGHAGRGKTMNRSPSLSRNMKPSSQINQKQKIKRPQALKPGTRPSSPLKKAAINKRPEFNTPSRDQINQFLKERPVGKPAQRPSTLPNRKPGKQAVQKPGRTEGGLGGGRPNRTDRKRLEDPGRRAVSNKLRDKIENKYPNRNDWFSDNFRNDRNRHRPPYYRPGENWWKWATAVGVASWFGWRNQPIYYGYSEGYYGDGYYGGYDNEGYNDDSAYWDETEDAGSSAPATDYSEQAEQIETAKGQNEGSEWMPLGVFAVSKEGGETVAPNIYMQLAVNKDGLISGIFYNTTTDKSYELEGLVDNRSQIAAWKMSESENAPIVETGIYNLTQDETKARVTFADGQTQNIYLIRMEQ